MESRVVRIAFVPAAGLAKKLWFCGIPLPSFFEWRIFNILLQFPRVSVKYTGIPNRETIARLQKILELFKSGGADSICVVGGSAKGCDYPTSRQMKDWLVGNGIPEENIYAGSHASDSQGHARELFDYAKKIQAERVEIHIVTSWYHMLRAKIDLFCVWKKADYSHMKATAAEHHVQPPISGEYLFNVITEPVKILWDLMR